MKKKGLLFILVSVLCSMCALFVGCDEGANLGAGEGASGSKQLATPFVVVSNEGVASWSAIANASGYAYKINDGAEKTTLDLSVQLTDGQSITVKAVGDGTNYTDSAYSVAQTYTVDGNGGGVVNPLPSDPTGAPVYLGIAASNTAPSSTTPDFAPTPSATGYTNISVIKNYLENIENSLGQPLPIQTDYDLYTSRNSTVYVKIWFNNPNQHTILSLKINGTKYQVGGGLTSYFYADGTNCVFVQLTTPENVNTIDYVVSEIEYVEGSNVNQNGTMLFIGDNDTVSVGLWYNTMPSVNISQTNLSCYSVSYSVEVLDADNVISEMGAWVRAVLFNGTTIIGQKKLVVGQNDITFNGLSEERNYVLAVVQLVDALNGEGVTAENIAHGDYSFDTKPIVEVNAGTKGNYKLISGVSKAEIYVDVTKYDENKSFEKVAIYLDNDYPTYVGGDETTEETVDGTITNGNGEIVDGNITSGGGSRPTEIPKTPDFVYSKQQLQTMGFNGQGSFSDGILNGKKYIVRVYYSDTEYARAEIQTPVYQLPEIQSNRDTEYVKFYNDAMFGYTFYFDGSYPEGAYVKDYEVHFRATEKEGGSILYDLTAGDENFFDSGFSYLEGSVDWENTNGYYTYVNERKLYFIRLENYLSSRIYERMSELNFSMWIVADLNDGLGARSFEVDDFYFYHNEGPNGVGYYTPSFEFVDTNEDEKGDTLVIRETVNEYVNFGYLYKIEFFELENVDNTHDIILNGSNSINEEDWIALYLQGLEDIKNDPENQPWEDPLRGWQYPYVSLWGNLPTAEDYLRTLSGTEQIENIKTENVNTTGYTPGYYGARLYYRYENVYYDSGEGEKHYNSLWERVLKVMGPQLATPTVTIDGKNATWNEVTNATGYMVYINGEEVSGGNGYYGRTYTMSNDGDYIQVQAISGSEEDALYPASNLSAKKTYHAPKLATPTGVRFEGVDGQWSTHGTLYWNAVENATMYAIYQNGYVVGHTSETFFEGAKSSYTYQVQAIGDGYKDSDLSSST